MLYLHFRDGYVKYGKQESVENRGETEQGEADNQSGRSCGPSTEGINSFELKAIERKQIGVYPYPDIGVPSIGTAGDLIEQSESDKAFGFYQQDPEGTADVTTSMSTQDLISWSFQVARGMGYLASKKVRYFP